MLGSTFLKTQEYKKEPIDTPAHTQNKQCPTCAKIFNETSDLNKHRAHRPKFQQQWKREAI